MPKLLPASLASVFLLTLGTACREKQTEAPAQASMDTHVAKPEEPFSSTNTSDPDFIRIDISLGKRGDPDIRLGINGQFSRGPKQVDAAFSKLTETAVNPEHAVVTYNNKFTTERTRSMAEAFQKLRSEANRATAFVEDMSVSHGPDFPVIYHTGINQDRSIMCSGEKFAEPADLIAKLSRHEIREVLLIIPETSPVGKELRDQLRLARIHLIDSTPSPDFRSFSDEGTGGFRFPDEDPEPPESQ